MFAFPSTLLGLDTLQTHLSSPFQAPTASHGLSPPKRSLRPNDLDAAAKRALTDAKRALTDADERRAFPLDL